LDECVGATKGLGWLELTGNPPKDLKKAHIAGFYGDLEVNKLFGQKNCTVKKPVGDAWSHYCAVTAGSSGSPLFYEDKQTGILNVFGV
jgi:V8-like Glu-specific endopeptidase